MNRCLDCNRTYETWPELEEHLLAAKHWDEGALNRVFDALDDVR